MYMQVYIYGWPVDPTGSRLRRTRADKNRYAELIELRWDELSWVESRRVGRHAIGLYNVFILESDSVMQLYTMCATARALTVEKCYYRPILDRVQADWRSDQLMFLKYIHLHHMLYSEYVRLCNVERL